MTALKSFISKILLVSMILNIFTFNICLAYDNIDCNDVDIYSKGSILIDQLTNRTLYQKNPDKKMPLASLSKMMTFLIAIESIENGKVKEDDLVEIDKELKPIHKKFWNDIICEYNDNYI